MIHEGIPVENTFAHFNDIEIVISEGHSIPEDASISRLGGFPITILAYDILNGVQLTPAVIGVNDNLSSPQLGLLVSIHNMVGMHSIVGPLV